MSGRMLCSAVPHCCIVRTTSRSSAAARAQGVRMSNEYNVFDTPHRMTLLLLSSPHHHTVDRSRFVLYVYTDYYKTYNVNTLQVQLQYIISYLRILWLHLPHEQHRVVECWYRVGALILIMYRIYITLYRVCALILIMYRIYITLYHVCALILIMYMIYTTQSGSDHSWYHTRTLSIIKYVTHTLYVKIQRLSYDSINTHVTRTTHSGRVFVSCTCAHPYNVYHVYDIYIIIVCVHTIYTSYALHAL